MPILQTRKKFSELSKKTNDELRAYMNASRELRDMHPDEAERIMPENERREMERFFTQMGKIRKVEIDVPMNPEYMGFARVVLASCKTLEINRQDILQRFAEDNFLYTQAFWKTTRIVLGDEIRRIPAGAFSMFVNLREITGGRNVNTIERDAMFGCKNLLRVDCIDKHDVEVEQSAIYGCESLKSHWIRNSGVPAERRNFNEAVQQRFGNQARGRQDINDLAIIQRRQAVANPFANGNTRLTQPNGTPKRTDNEMSK